MVAGDFPGDVSSLRDCEAESCPMFKPSGGWDELLGVENPIACGICAEFGNCGFAVLRNDGKCFWSDLSIPSLVNGFGKTSFIPITS